MLATRAGRHLRLEPRVNDEIPPGLDPGPSRGRATFNSPLSTLNSIKYFLQNPHRLNLPKPLNMQPIINKYLLQQHFTILSGDMKVLQVIKIRIQYADPDCGKWRFNYQRMRGLGP